MLRKTAIRAKKGECVDCTDGKPKPLTAGRCRTHYWIYRSKQNEKSVEGRTISERSVVPQNKLDERQKAVGQSNPYFEYWMRYCGFKCEECGAAISSSDQLGLLSAQAHILPKAHFKSVALVLENHITLGQRCGCHNRYDKSWESAQKMTVWNVATERFKKFMHLIAPDEIRRLPEPLRKIYDQSVVG